MPISPYIKGLREHVGHALLLLPGVTAVIHDQDRFLLARQADTERWSLLGGSIEPGEEPVDALIREVTEEIGQRPTELRILGAYGGPELMSAYPNGDEVAYVTTAYLCRLADTRLELEQDEVLEVRWFREAEIGPLHRHTWIDRVIADAIRSRPGRTGY